MSYPIAPKTTEQARAFLKSIADSGSTSWYCKCLSSERQARGLPGGVASAKVAAGMVPAQYRVKDVTKIKPGMIMFFGAASSTYGHIVFVNAIRTPNGVAKSLDDIEVYTNDVVGHGKIGLCRASYFPAHWHQEFDHAAVWLNGYVFPEWKDGLDQKPPIVETRGVNIDVALEFLKAARSVAQKTKADAKAKVLTTAINDLNKLPVTKAPEVVPNIKSVKAKKSRGQNVDDALASLRRARNAAKATDPARAKVLTDILAGLNKGIAPLTK